MKAIVLCYFVVALLIVSSQEEECAQVRCSVACHFGFKRDENGCNTCICAEDDGSVTPCGAEQCSGAQVCRDEACECPLMRCRIRCQFGFKKDRNGCEYPCICAEMPEQG